MADQAPAACGHGQAALPQVVYERSPGAASAPLPGGYRPRQPEKTVLHQVVREHLETFFEEGRRRSAHGDGYPAFVEKEFRRYLACGILSRGFVRLKCGSPTTASLNRPFAGSPGPRGFG